MILDCANHDWHACVWLPIRLPISHSFCKNKWKMHKYQRYSHSRVSRFLAIIIHKSARLPDSELKAGARTIAWMVQPETACKLSCMWMAHLIGRNSGVTPRTTGQTPGQTYCKQHSSSYPCKQHSLCWSLFPGNKIGMEWNRGAAHSSTHIHAISSHETRIEHR